MFDLRVFILSDRLLLILTRISSRRAIWMSLVAAAFYAFCVSTLSAQDSLNSRTAETCPDGVISSIDVESQTIYDPSSTSVALLAWTYRVLDLMHINTREAFIRSELLFQEGDCFDSFLMSESERLLDSHGFMYVEEMSAQVDGEGGYSVQVVTRDEWSTKIDVGPTFDEGSLNLERFQVTEENFLGNGIFAEFTRYVRRETSTQSVGLSTPRFFGRSDAGVAAGTSRAGRFFDHYWRYPFVGEAGRVSVREGYKRGSDFFAYSADGAEPFDQVLVPVSREEVELSGAYRFGNPGESIILGGSISRDVLEFRSSPEVTFGDFDVRDPLPGAQPLEMQRQLSPYAATRIALHFGTRRFRYTDYTGLDDLRHTQLTALGLFAGVTVGKSLNLFHTDRAPNEDDFFTRGHLSFTHPLGLSLVHASGTVEARYDEVWRDILADADVAFYGRTSVLASHTLFVRATTSGGWNTHLPYQLVLGGRAGIRSLTEDRFPGGRMLRFVFEDRIMLPWPRETADLGITLFSDLGRIWAGDVPYGVTTDWKAALGFGLRIGLPRNTRNIWRTDIAFPVEGGSPVFRVTLELNKLRDGFVTEDVGRSRRFNVGPETFFY
ncbi:MAG: hypothetical protein MK239_02290 [Gemmatimonadetes bacterium]|nr:hypothetical protein [Gemmatimonadota bacterium]